MAVETFIGPFNHTAVFFLDESDQYNLNPFPKRHAFAIKRTHPTNITKYGLSHTKNQSTVRTVRWYGYSQS